MLKFFINNWETLIGWVIGIISLLYAIKESNEKKRINKLIRSNNWILYQRTSNLGGEIQKSLEKAQKKDIDRDFYEDIVRSDALCGELIKENIRLIQSFEPSFEEKDIKKWRIEGKIDEGYADIFRKYMIVD